jgi:hypothetical protein
LATWAFLKALAIDNLVDLTKMFMTTKKKFYDIDSTDFSSINDSIGTMLVRVSQTMLQLLSKAGLKKLHLTIIDSLGQCYKTFYSCNLRAGLTTPPLWCSTTGAITNIELG